MSHFADAEAAPVAIATIGFSSLKKGNCEFIFNSDAYKSAESGVNKAKTDVEQAKGKLDEAVKGVDASLKAAAIAKKDCQCRTAQKANLAYETASQNFAKDSKAAWTKAHHLQCVLNATPLKDCIVKDLPEIKKPTLAPGVTADACDAECPPENGFCVDANNGDVKDGVIKINSGDYLTPDAEQSCLKLCKSYKGATGCETIWNQGNKGCYIHTNPAIVKGNGATNHHCWVFSKCKGAGNMAMAPPKLRL